MPRRLEFPPQMPPHSRRNVLGARDTATGDRRMGKASSPGAAGHGIRIMDSLAWETNRASPFRFLRWLSAVATVVAEWAGAGAPQSVVSYLPVLLVVGLLLLPDAQSVTIGASGLKFERLTSEVEQQRRDVDRLTEAVVSLISMNATSNVTITIGPGELAAALAATAAQSEGRREAELLSRDRF
jgi:hypothetical protein